MLFRFPKHISQGQNSAGIQETVAEESPIWWIIITSSPMAANGAVTVLRTSSAALRESREIAMNHGPTWRVRTLASSKPWLGGSDHRTTALAKAICYVIYVLPQDRQEAAPGIHNVHIEDLNLGRGWSSRRREQGELPWSVALVVSKRTLSLSICIYVYIYIYV